MEGFYRVATALIFLGTVWSPAQADVVCGLDPLNHEFLSLRSGGGVRFIELTRLAPGTNLRVLTDSASCDQEPGWVPVAVPEVNLEGCVAKQFICPGPPGL
jgi:hypothetical protein